jgi:hypothetical protein
MVSLDQFSDLRSPHKPRSKKIQKTPEIKTPVESRLQRGSAGIEFASYADKPPFIIDPEFGPEVVRCFVKMGVETYRMNLENKAYQ